VAGARVARIRTSPAARVARARNGRGISDLPGREERDDGQRMTEFSGAA
jgi:hypothetical protein